MRKCVIFFTALIVLLISGCTPQENVEIVEEIPDVVLVSPKAEEEPLEEESVEEATPVEEPELPEPVATPHPIFETIRPLAVMLDNQLYARPQSGLEQAKVVYEILAEGSITRYMMLVEPEGNFTIGPVRSARPYFIAYAMEYGSLYAHAGGSEAAMSLLDELDVASLNGLRAGSGVYWRENHRKMPHNLYTSVKTLYKDIERLNYSVEAKESGTVLQYDYYVELETEEVANDFTVTYKPPSTRDPIGYSVSYAYDEESRVYLRSVNHEKQLDEATGVRIDAGSVIVLQADHRVVDSVGRREIDIVGTGEGYYLSMGKEILITWEKASLTAPTIYKDSDGENLIVNPGRLFIQVVDDLNQLTIEGE